jgi:hypothetical protein
MAWEQSLAYKTDPDEKINGNQFITEPVGSRKRHRFEWSLYLHKNITRR